MATFGKAPYESLVIVTSELPIHAPTETLELMSQDPIERLDELCRILDGSEVSYFTINFRNGIFIKLNFQGPVVDTTGAYKGRNYKDTFFTGDLLIESRFVPTQDLDTAKRVVAAIALNRMGLYDVEFEDENDSAHLPMTPPTEEEVISAMEQGVNMFGSVLKMVTKSENPVIKSILDRYVNAFKKNNLPADDVDLGEEHRYPDDDSAKSVDSDSDE